MVAEVDVADERAYEDYKKAAGKIITQFGGRYLSRGGSSLTLEGAQAKRVVIVEFDTMHSAERWYNSSEYQSAKALRERVAVGRLFVVEGLKP
jgi:uncharacterized protein (DUF1330 family)